jgi:hypothetical protein
MKLTKWFGMLGAVFVCGVTQAAGKVDFLEVNAGVVVFTTSAPKTVNSPSCVLSEYAEKWSISLNTQSGRASYSMLVTAMSMGIPINIESANNCAVLDGVEQAQRIWFDSQT